MYRLPLSPSVKSGEGVDAPSPIFTEGRGSVHRLGREMSAVFSRWNKKVESVGSVLTFPLVSNSLLDKSKITISGCFFVLRKPLLVRFCCVVLILFHVFSTCYITWFGDCTLTVVGNTMKLAHLMSVAP